MGIVEDIVTPKKNYILRMWLTAGAIVAVLFLFMLWHDRFRSECETEDVFYGILGIEQYGRVQKSFSGSNFFVRAQKMGLGGNAKEEVNTKIQELMDEGAIVPKDDAKSVPVLWLYAKGLSKEIRDEGFRSRGEIFFDREKICISVADDYGFSVQTNPETFTIFHAKTGDAICAIPLSERPTQNGKELEKFKVKIEFRNSEHGWKTIGEFPIKYSVPVKETTEEKPAEIAVETNPKLDEKIQNEVAEILNIVPESAKIEALSVPENCRFYSSELSEHRAFGKLSIELKSKITDEIPDNAWKVENVKIEASNKIWGYSGQDAFHTNVRFIYEDSFETREGDKIFVPIAKTLFPHDAGEKEEPWSVSARIIRTHSFKENELHEFGDLKISKSKTRLSFAGTTVGVRAFLEKEYFRLLKNGVPALVFEISADPKNQFFWQPFRVKTDKGEDLSVESIVIVRPGIYQYWFMPTSVPANVKVTYAITKVVEISSKINPEIHENKTSRAKEIP